MHLLVDNFDSFSHILADFFLQTGADLKIVRNDISLAELKKESYEALILSPGPATPVKAGNLMEILSYYHDKIPVLGVCLGHQAIGEFFGAKLIQSQFPKHGKVSQVYKTKENEIFRNLPANFDVTRYHSLELKDIPDELEVVLTTAQGEIMAVAHRYLPIIGIQFHPEAYLTAFGDKMIQNWVDFCKEDRMVNTY